MLQVHTAVKHTCVKLFICQCHRWLFQQASSCPSVRDKGRPFTNWETHLSSCDSPWPLAWPFHHPLWPSDKCHFPKIVATQENLKVKYQLSGAVLWRLTSVHSKTCPSFHHRQNDCNSSIALHFNFMEAMALVFV